MNSTQRKTLIALFKEPVCVTLEWRRVEAFLLAIDCEIIEGNGSRVAFKHSGIRADFHRPHPNKEAKAYQVRTVREFLQQIGISP
jgi:hypothetical protein